MKLLPSEIDTRARSVMTMGREGAILVLTFAPEPQSIRGVAELHWLTGPGKEMVKPATEHDEVAIEVLKDADPDTGWHSPAERTIRIVPTENFDPSLFSDCMNGRLEQMEVVFERAAIPA